MSEVLLDQLGSRSSLVPHPLTVDLVSPMPRVITSNGIFGSIPAICRGDPRSHAFFDFRMTLFHTSL
jgi:hypothetical protein